MSSLARVIQSIEQGQVTVLDLTKDIVVKSRGLAASAGLREAVDRAVQSSFSTVNMQIGALPKDLFAVIGKEIWDTKQISNGVSSSSYQCVRHFFEITDDQAQCLKRWNPPLLNNTDGVSISKVIPLSAQRWAVYGALYQDKEVRTMCAFRSNVASGCRKGFGNGFGNCSAQSSRSLVTAYEQVDQRTWVAFLDNQLNCTKQWNVPIGGTVTLLHGGLLEVSCINKSVGWIRIFDSDGECLKSIDAPVPAVVSQRGEVVGYPTGGDGVQQNEFSPADLQLLWQTLATNKTVKECCLQGLAMGDEGAADIAQMLRLNRTITQLNLCNTGISDVGAKLLLAALKVNTRVVDLVLDDNNIGPLLKGLLKERLVQHRRYQAVSNAEATVLQTFNIPDMCRCAITQLVMVDPVLTVDGHTYERETIARWLEKNNTSPNSGLLLSTKDLIPNFAIKQLISSLHTTYSTLIHSKEVYFLQSLQAECVQAARADKGDEVALLASKDQRLLSTLLEFSEGEPLMTLLVFALKKGSINFLKRIMELLGPEGVQNESAQDGWSFFDMAACYHGVEGARLIGGILEWNNADYEDRLFEAIGKKDVLMTGICLDLGVPLNAFDDQGNTPLHAAVFAGNIPLIELLLRRGASIREVNNNGLTPQALAKTQERSDLANFMGIKRQELKMAPYLASLMTLIGQQQKQIQELQSQNHALVQGHDELRVEIEAVRAIGARAIFHNESSDNRKI